MKEFKVGDVVKLFGEPTLYLVEDINNVILYLFDPIDANNSMCGIDEVERQWRDM